MPENSGTSYKQFLSFIRSYLLALCSSSQFSLFFFVLLPFLLVIGPHPFYYRTELLLF
ncbi:hypothetical protein DM02DRAFT_685740 [Periconia macrospinosa]|uniref:Uncharacterized protein n=1 Tax=Periconia macrospinosa TaxID=97972 RepID=A0A2V1DGL0_9PLEO|nr:hypothetical protein DM02DRAFT_685740 [Periconia macrospinosa]